MLKGILHLLHEKRAKRLIRHLPKLKRGPAKFLRRYPNYQIGVGTYGLPIVHDWQEGATLSIGCYSSIAEQVEIFLGGHHRTEWITTYPFPVMTEEAKGIEGYAFSRGDVTIGSDVWLCSNAIILSGVSIGHGAVVAAGAVVSRDVEPYSVVAGNPARHIRWRFAEDARHALLESRWWEWSEEEVSQISPLLCSAEIDVFLDYVRKRPGSKGL